MKEENSSGEHQNIQGENDSGRRPRSIADVDESSGTDLSAGLSVTQLGVLLHGGSPDLPFSRDLLVMNCHVAGASHVEGMKELITKLKPGMRLKLIREPENEYDSMAVRLYWGNTRIGYLPRRNNEVIARLMDYGKYFYAVISRVTPYSSAENARQEEHSWNWYLEEAIRVDVFMQD